MQIPEHAYLVLPANEFALVAGNSTSDLLDGAEFIVLVPASNAEALTQAVRFLKKLTGTEHPEMAGRIKLDDTTYRMFLIK